MPSVTIKDIARELNLSHTTVSRALNNRGDISIPDTTRQRIIKTAAVMGYRPNRAARALLTGRTHNLAVVAESFVERSGPHFARMLAGIEQKARDLGYKILVCGDVLSVQEERFADGIVMVASADDPRLDDLARMTPCVFVGYRMEKASHWFSWDDFNGGRIAAKYLLELGHRKIAAIWGNMDPRLADAVDKAHGFRESVRQSGISLMELWGERDPDQFENGFLLGAELVKQHPEITAIFARNDLIALGAMKAIRKAGLRVPEDISVIGYNDTSYSQYSDPALTSMRTPVVEVGQLAVEHLVKMIEGDTLKCEGMMLPVAIAERESCVRCKTTG